VARDGRRLNISLTVSPLKDPQGRVIGASKVARDITERRLSEQARQRFVTLIESSGEFIGMSDLQGRPFFVNAAGLQLVGLDSLADALAVPVTEFFFPEDRAFIADEFLPRVQREGRAEVEIRFRHFKTGEALWVIYSVVVLADEHGRATGYGTVTRDVTERRRTEEALRESDRRKDEFLATLSHELRNPLAPIRTALGILGSSGAGGREREWSVQIIERQVRQMVRLLDDLLDISRIAHNKLELRRETVDLRSVLDEAVETSRPFLDVGRHDVAVTLPGHPVYLHADRIRLGQVFANLLTNSAKYTDPGGRLEVDVQPRGGVVLVRVTDNGIGMTPEVLARVFDMFSQDARAVERSQGGLGIGLAIVHGLVELHGGTIAAASEGPGRGSTFTVTLPVVGKPADTGPTAGEVAAPRARPRRVLIADDREDGAESLATLLRLEGHDARTAQDGEEAVALAEQFRPELVCLDVGMPRLNGHEACRRIRAQPWGRTMRIVAVTGWGQEDDRQASRDAGFDDHLVKPVDPATVLALLSDLPD
jgi:PAS domain S-box-containing protein